VSCPPPADPCLDAECVPATGACVEVPAATGTLCDDASPCTIGDHCVDGVCVPGASICECDVDGDCAPYENGVGDPDPVVKTVNIVSGVAETVDFDLPETGHVCVDVDDEQGDPIPARVTVVGFDPSPEPIVPGFSFFGFSSDPLGLFNDVVVNRKVVVEETGLDLVVGGGLTGDIRLQRSSHVLLCLPPDA